MLGALREDQAFREGKKGQLYRLSELAPFSRLGHGLPALRSTHCKKLGTERVSSDAEFSKRLDRAAPALRGFRLRENGFVLAGGAVCACLMWGRPGPREFSDFDLFLVGLTERQALASIKALAAHLASSHSDRPDTKMHVSRTVNCITFGLGNQLYQVILRLFETPPDVIGDFDLGSCAVLWDGQAVHLTALGRVAAERGANVLNVAAHRLTYERRLVRYFGRGFDIVLPNLDVARFLESSGSLPFLDVDLGGEVQCPCHFAPRNVVPRDPRGRPSSRLPAGASRRDGWEEYNEERRILYAGSEAGILGRNLEALARGSFRGLHAREAYTPYLDIFAIEPRVDPNALLDLVLDKDRRPAAARTLKRVLGEALALELLQASLAHAEEGDKFKEVARAICQTRAGGLEAGARIRFAFLDARPAAPDPGARAISQAQWYGLVPLPESEP